MADITIKLMGITYKPHGRSEEKLPADAPISVKDILLKIGYREVGLEFFIIHRNGEVLKLDSLVNPGDELSVFMPLGGG